MENHNLDDEIKVLVKTKRVELVEDINGFTEHGDEVTIPAGQTLVISEEVRQN